MGSSTATLASTRTAGCRPRWSGNGVTLTFASFTGVSPETTLAAMQEDDTSVPGSGCTSNVRSTWPPRKTVPLAGPRDRAAAADAKAQKPRPSDALRSFKVYEAIDSHYSCTQAAPRAEAIMG